jgi:hypothetical protein
LGAYNRAVTVAYDVIWQLALEWQREPYHWEAEADIQAELATRLRQIYQWMGIGQVTELDPKARDPIDRECRTSRVSCSPAIDLDRSGKLGYCKPDVVVWGEHDPDAWAWPILWACEIKYCTSRKSDADIEKLKRLIKSGRIEAGCAFEVKYVRGNKSGIDWDTSGLGQKLWRCQLTLPARKD